MLTNDRWELSRSSDRPTLLVPPSGPVLGQVYKSGNSWIAIYGSNIVGARDTRDEAMKIVEQARSEELQRAVGVA